MGCSTGIHKVTCRFSSPVLNHSPCECQEGRFNRLLLFGRLERLVRAVPSESAPNLEVVASELTLLTGQIVKIHRCLCKHSVGEQVVENRVNTLLHRIDCRI